MSGHVPWRDIRAEHVARAGGEDAVAAGKQELLAEVIGHRLAQLRKSRGMTQQQVADRMGVTKGRVSQIEQGKVSGQDVLARFRRRVERRLHQAFYFDDGKIAAIAWYRRRRGGSSTRRSDHSISRSTSSSDFGARPNVA